LLLSLYQVEIHGHFVRDDMKRAKGTKRYETLISVMLGKG